MLCLVERRGLKLNFCPTFLRRSSCVLSCFFEFFSVWAFSPETPEAGPRLPLVIRRWLRRIADSRIAGPRRANARARRPLAGSSAGRPQWRPRTGPGPRRGSTTCSRWRRPGACRCGTLRSTSSRERDSWSSSASPRSGSRRCWSAWSCCTRWRTRTTARCTRRCVFVARRARRPRSAYPRFPALARRKTTGPLRERSRRAPLSTDFPLFPHLT